MDDIVTQVNAWFTEAMEHEQEWRLQAKEDYEFYLGHQWDEASREKLGEEGRPVLTINKIKPIVKLLCGFERQSRMDIKCLPMEGSDVLVADILTTLFKSIMVNNNGEHELSYQFQDGLICGRGFAYVSMDFSHDMVNGDIAVKALRPFNVLVDPYSTEYDLSDAFYAMRVISLRRRAVKGLYPQMAEAIDSIMPEDDHCLLYPRRESGEGYSSANAKGQRPGAQDMLLIRECWYRESHEENYIGDRQSGELVRTNLGQDKLKALMETNVIGSGTKQSNRFFMVKRLSTSMSLATVCGGVLLERRESPFSSRDYPVMPFYAEFTPGAPNFALKFQGIVRALKDPQREINKRRAQLLHIINTAANSGWIMEHGALRDKRILERFGSKPGVVIEVEPGRRLERITPAPTPRGYIDLEAISTENIKEISAVNADLLGQYEKTTPGVAIQLRQRQGITAAQELFDNFRLTKKLLGRFLVGAIQDYYTPEKILRVTGTGFLAQERGAFREAAALLETADLSRFDIAVDEAINTPTHRLANFYTLLELVKMGLPIAPELIIEASDLPNKKEIITRLKVPGF